MHEDAASRVARIAIVTDSTADIPARMAAANGIEVVPLHVTIDGETFADGDLSQEDFFGRMGRAPKLPTTSQPPVGAFVEAYERVLRTADAVISVHISDKLSGTIGSARQAAVQFGDRIHVFDSGNLSWGLGFQVLEVARVVATGAGIKDALAAAANIRDRVRLIVGVDSLDNLAKGGRIGGVARFLGSMLDLKVTFMVEDGTFVPLKRTRGAAAALEQTRSWIAEQMGSARSGAFCVLHAMSEDRAVKLAGSLRAAYDVTEMHVVPVGVVIATHTGTGWGVAFVPGE